MIVRRATSPPCPARSRQTSNAEGSMKVRSFGFPRSRERHLLAMLALIASLAMTIGATTQVQAGQLAKTCAQKEIAVITLIEDHGTAEDLPADRVSNATMTML